MLPQGTVSSFSFLTFRIGRSPASVFWRADDDVGVIPSGETWRGAIGELFHTAFRSACSHLGITVLKAHDGTQIVVFCLSDFVNMSVFSVIYRALTLPRFEISTPWLHGIVL
jgi:hypothetical protein